MEDRINLKPHGDITARFVPARIVNMQTGDSHDEAEVQIHHRAGMTISLDRNEALTLLAFLRWHELDLLNAVDPEAL